MSLDVVVIGGGVAGLAVAHTLRRKRPDWSLAVLEKDVRPGGLVRSEEADGFNFDWGPNGFQPVPATMELVEELGLTEQLLPVSDRVRFRYLYLSGGLRRLPTKPQEFLASELLSPAGKFRAALEPLLARRSDGEESVFDFVARHFGHEAARALAAPMVLGVAAGDARRLSLDALFPRLRRMETRHRSLIRALAAAKGKRPVGPPLYSFRSGMGVLTARLAQSLGEAVHSDSEAVSLSPQDGGFEIGLASGERIWARRVVAATPSFVAARLLRPFLPEAAEPLEGIRHAGVQLFALAFQRVDVPHPLDGFGFLVPRGQGLRSLGVLWSSSLFSGRAPAGMVLLRVIAGGGADPGFLDLTEDHALAVVRRDLKVSLGVTARPVFQRRLVFGQALPQYELGHRERVKRAFEALRRFSGLVLAGNSYNGIAVNDCVRDARRAVSDLLGERMTEASGR